MFSVGGNLSRSIARNAEDGKVFTEAELQILLRQIAQVCVHVVTLNVKFDLIELYLHYHWYATRLSVNKVV